MDSDWWTRQSLGPGYCSNWLSNGWSLIELSEAPKAWRPHEQRPCCEISSALDSYFDQKMKSFFHYSLAFAAFALARSWDSKGRSTDRARASQGTEAGSQKWDKCFGFGWREGGEHVNPVIKLWKRWKGSCSSWTLLVIQLISLLKGLSQVASIMPRSYPHQQPKTQELQWFSTKSSLPRGSALQPKMQELATPTRNFLEGLFHTETVFHARSASDRQHKVVACIFEISSNLPHPEDLVLTQLLARIYPWKGLDMPSAAF